MDRPEEARPIVAKVQASSKERFGLPPTPPRAKDGARCRLCVNQCSIPEGEKGYCGLRENRDGRLRHLVGPDKGIVQWYHDLLPTNCVAMEVCPGGEGCNDPRFSHSEGAEHGFKNLAVFLGACTFNCLYCQNWSYRELTQRLRPLRSPEDMAAAADETTSCICYFGGDPTPQLPFALKASRLAIESRPDQITRICWESNGSMMRGPLKKAVELSMESGGGIKFDLKAHDNELHLALCGVVNSQTLDNFKWMSGLIDKRPEVPLVVASTLMVPGYVDAEQVRGIAEFIASCNPSIPYRLLAFHGDFIMDDLRPTRAKEAEACRKAALDAGLEKVEVGNIHLLW
jgi:pyruvate formate lyase activating enzyme